MTSKAIRPVHLVQVANEGQWNTEEELEHKEVEAYSPWTSKIRRRLGSWEVPGIAWATWWHRACVLGKEGEVPGRQVQLLDQSYYYKEDQCDGPYSSSIASEYAEHGGLLHPT